MSLTLQERRRAGHLKRLYGITPEQYLELLVKQNFCCYVCERHEDDFKVRLSVDHNHKTGEIRGLLCTHCNRTVIGRHTDPRLLFRASQYLSQGTGWFVPEAYKSRRRKRKKKK